MFNKEFFEKFEDLFLNNAKSLEEVKELEVFIKKPISKKGKQGIVLGGNKIWGKRGYGRYYINICKENGEESSITVTNADIFGGFNKGLLLMCQLRENEIINGNIEAKRAERLSDNKKVASKKSTLKGFFIMAIIIIVANLIINSMR